MNNDKVGYKFSYYKNYSFVKCFLKHKEIFLLVFISILLAVFFIYDGFATPDSIRYTIGIQEINRQGIKEIPKMFNGEMSFGYYLLINLIDKIISHSCSFITLMNVVNCVFSVLMIFFLFFLFYSFFGDKIISFFSCLTVLFSPSIWHLSHYGHPVLISLAFFIISLFILDKTLVEKTNHKYQKIYWFFFILSSLLAITIRLDIVLAFGAYFGLLYFRKKLLKKTIMRIIIALSLILVLLFLMRYFILGYLINPTGGTFSYHFTTRLEPEYIVKNIARNSILWAMGTNAFISLLAVFGFVFLKQLTAFKIFVLSWIAPFCVIFPFRGMDSSRITAPTIPVISLFAMYFIASLFKKRQLIAFVGVFILAQLMSIAAYYPATMIYSFKTKIEGRYLASFPLGFLPSDYKYRQEYIHEISESAKRVANETKGNVLIIDAKSGSEYYIYYLLHDRNIIATDRIRCEETILDKYVTSNNIFYFLDFNHNLHVNTPIKNVLHCKKINLDKIHLVKFSADFHIEKNTIYLSEKDIKSVLALEQNAMNKRRQIIH